jgi:hypothetical protein
MMPRTAAAARRTRHAITEPLEGRVLLSGVVGGSVYEDLTSNGHTADDPGVAGVTVELLPMDNLDHGRRSTVTGADGAYRFDDVPDGTWMVRRLEIPGVAGPDYFYPIGVPYGGPPVDFAIVRPGTISGTLFDDVDRDGVRDPGEPPLAGRPVYIDYDHDGTPYGDLPATTGPDGSYSFQLQPGTYRVRPGAADGARVEPLFQDVTLHSSGVITGADFGVSPVLAVSGLTLIDAATDQPIGPLEHGMTIDLAEVGRRLSVRADLDPATRPADVRSVRFNYDGNVGYKVENAAPYAIAGDTAGDYGTWTPRVGTHTLVVTPYGSSNGAGEQGRSVAINFNVIDTSAPAGTTLRVNAGGGAYTTAAGEAYAADAGFRGAITRDKPFPVAGTDDDSLYSSLRLGRRLQFSAPVASGAYTLRLHFADPTQTRAGRRVFDVFSENRRVLHDYDVVADAGPRAAAVKQFNVTVADGRLDLLFAAKRDLALVSAIELLPVMAAPSTPAPFLVDAGAPADTIDADGRRFERDRTGRYGFTGGTASSAVYDVGAFNPYNQEFSPLPDSPLWATYRAGNTFTFNRPVANGHYAVFLGFAEPAEGAVAGSRVFDVSAEGRLALDDYDIVKDAGAARRQTVQSFDVNVTDGSLDLAFRGVVGDALVSYVAAFPTDVPGVALPYAPDASSDAAREAAAARNLRMIGLAISMYSNEFKGRFPPSLATLPGTEVDDARMFADPRAGTHLPRGDTSAAEDRAWVAAHDDYVYLGRGKKYTDFGPATPLAYENPRRVPGAIYVLFGDLHVERLGREDAAALLGFDPSPPAQAPVFHDPPDPAARQDPAVIASAANLRTLWAGIADFANLHRPSVFPRDFGILHEVEDVPPGAFADPRLGTRVPAGMTEQQAIIWAARSTDYRMLASNRRFVPSDLPVVWENPAELRGGINLAFDDGRVEFRELRWAVDSIRAAQHWVTLR